MAPLGTKCSSRPLSGFSVEVLHAGQGRRCFCGWSGTGEPQLYESTVCAWPLHCACAKMPAPATKMTAIAFFHVRLRIPVTDDATLA